MISSYRYGSILVELDAEAGDGILLQQPVELDVSNPCPTTTTLVVDGEEVQAIDASTVSLQTIDWERATHDLRAAGFELATLDPIGMRGDCEAWPLVRLGEAWTEF